MPGPLTMPYGDFDICDECAFGVEGEHDVCDECDLGDCFTPADEALVREHTLFDRRDMLEAA